MGFLSNVFGMSKKTVPQIDPIIERTRDGIAKAYIPKFLYKPPHLDIPDL